MSGGKEGGEKKDFQFVDRRRFDADGNERGKEPLDVTGGAAPSVAASKGGQTPSTENSTAAPLGAQLSNPAVDADAIKAEYRPEASANPDDDVTFTSFIMSLGTQTMVQLGEMDPPPGMEVPMDVEAARQTIDILSMLQKKTKGNLSADESRFLVEVLHTLRMSYVRRSQQ